MTKIQRLEKIAELLPSMDGKKAGSILRSYASEVREGCIVEAGVWLGGCTAYLALGCLDAKRRIMIHVYDRFRASRSEVNKAATFGLRLREGQETSPIFDDHLKPFHADIVKHIGNLKSKSWTGGPIGLYIDDASKRQPEFDHARREFFPSVIPGGVVILMDYNYYLKRRQDAGLRYQFEVMSKDEGFEHIGEIPGTSAAIFRKL